MKLRKRIYHFEFGRFTERSSIYLTRQALEARWYVRERERERVGRGEMEGRAVVEKRERTGEASGLVQKGPENRENERDRLTGIERGYAIGVKGKRGKKK